MGYTHYWTTRENAFMPHLWTAAVDDCAEVIALAIEAGIELAGWDGNGAPVANGVEIGFNGKGDEAYESFVVSRQSEKRAGRDFAFSFCKTARKPYDVAVTACLVVLKRHLGDSFRVSSDGDVSDWTAGLELANRVLGAQYTISDFDGDIDGDGMTLQPEECPTCGHHVSG